MHGQTLKETDKEAIDEKELSEWLKFRELKGKTKSLITACQEQWMATKHLKARILKTGTGPKYRLCRTETKIIPTLCQVSQFWQRENIFRIPECSCRPPTLEHLETIWNQSVRQMV